MNPAGRFLLTLLIGTIGCSLVAGDAPVVSTQYSSYIPPVQDTYSVPIPSTHYSAPSTQYGTPSKDYGAPAKGGYAPAVKPTYGVPPAPTPSYGPPPAAYGPPPQQGYAYGHIRDFDSQVDNSFLQKRLFNTSVALTVPLFSFTLPQRSLSGSEPSGTNVDLANQVIFAIFAVFVVILVFAVPVLFTGNNNYRANGRSSDRDGILNNLMASQKVFNFMGADMANNIGLDTQKCLKKTICEAHKFPKKYGILAAPFQMFFPPPSNGTSEARASSYQLAAKDGKSKKDCAKSYKCFFDLLDLADYCIDWWKYSSNPNYVTEM